MQGVFINYRTGDGDEAAVILEQGLSRRFGKELVFRDTMSIQPGQAYPERLLNAVRSSAVVLAVMGPGWARDPRLRDESDWVRREILEAMAAQIPVIPVLKGRRTEPLKAGELPPELARLADIQFFRLEPQDSEAGIKRIGDHLAGVVPAFREADRQASSSSGTDAAHNLARDTRGTVIQSHSIQGDVGTVIKGNQGPIHAGRGDIKQFTQHFSGDGATYIQGDNHGGVGHRFLRTRRDEE